MKWWVLSLTRPQRNAHHPMSSEPRVFIHHPVKMPPFIHKYQPVSPTPGREFCSVWWNALITHLHLLPLGWYTWPDQGWLMSGFWEMFDSKKQTEWGVGEKETGMRVRKSEQERWHIWPRVRVLWSNQHPVILHIIVPIIILDKRKNFQGSI